MNRKMVTVVIPVYNAEKFLEDCLESVATQSIGKEKFDVIIINDGSTDKSEDICRNYTYIYDNFYLYSTNNRGSNAARLYGAQRAETEYITFLDADDWLEENYLTEFLTVADRTDADIIVAGYRSDQLIVENKISHGFFQGEEFNEIIRRVFFGGLYQEFGILPEIWGKFFHKKDIIP